MEKEGDIMKILKKIAAAVLAGALVLSFAVPTFAYGWYKSGNSWMYEGTNGNYVKKRWLQIEGDWYHFDKDGIMDANRWIDGKYYVGMDGVMLTNTTTPDGFRVGADGAKIRGGGNSGSASGGTSSVSPAPAAGISGPGAAAISSGKVNPNLQADPLVGILNAGDFLEYKGNDHSVMFTRSSQGMLFMTVAHGSAGISGTEIDEALILRRDGDGYVFGKLDTPGSEMTVYFGGNSVTLANGQGAHAHLNGTYYRK